jgi:ribosomal protein S18 acetylase RimI-like enzyme
LATTIRPYQPGDRDALLHIGAETAFFGAPVEHTMEDRRIFMDAFYACYTDFESQHAWVACDGNQVVGFLTGAFDSRRHTRLMRQKILPSVLWKFLRGHYHLGPKTWRYSRGVMTAFLQNEFPPVDLDRFPAHLHINILPAWRGQGLGRKLIHTYQAQLIDRSIQGVHLETTNLNEAACHLYESTGFHLQASRFTNMYASFVNQPVELRIYAMELP